MSGMNLLKKYRILLGGFMLGVALSGITAFPLTWELKLLAQITAQLPFESLHEWIVRVRDALVETDARHPFLAYGFDWLAFAHLMIAAAYIGPYREPVRNRFLLEWGMFCCVATWPVAFICGPIRGIPFGWILVDCAFGIVAFPVLWTLWKWSKQLETGAQTAPVSSMWSDYPNPDPACVEVGRSR